MIKAIKYCSIVTMLFVILGCKQELIGDMKLKEAFTPEVAEFVDAVLKDDFQKADEVLKGNININAIGKDGITPLLWLLAEEHAKDLEAVEFMLKHGADPNYIDPNRQVSAMYFASGGDKPEFLELLIKYGGDVNQIAKDDDSMLMVAASQGRKVNVDILLNNGADITAKNRFNHTVATRSLHTGDYQLVSYLLKQYNFNTDLQGLARLVEGIVASEDNQLMKEKVIDLLKQRGAEFPASGRLKKYIESRSVTEEEKWEMIYGRVKY